MRARQGAATEQAGGGSRAMDAERVARPATAVRETEASGSRSPHTGRMGLGSLDLVAKVESALACSE